MSRTNNSITRYKLIVYYDVLNRDSKQAKGAQGNGQEPEPFLKSSVMRATDLMVTYEGSLTLSCQIDNWNK